jgi:magnesium-transporting ATPase (P-type)
VLKKDVYQGPSPDEITLVESARIMGYKYLRSSSATITIEIRGKETEFELLELFPFDSDRKRMSVVLRYHNQIRMFTKGADSIIKGRLTETPAPFLN